MRQAGNLATYRQAADELTALKLGNKELSNVRAQIAVSYRQKASVSIAMTNIAVVEDGKIILYAGDSHKRRTIMAQFETAKRDLRDNVTVLQGQCPGTGFLRG